MIRRISRFFMMLIVLMSASTASAQKRLLFYGNSFTIATGFGSTRSIPQMIQTLATAAGQPSPIVVNPSVAGWSLQQHLTSNTATINTGLTAGQNWDAVILQDFSTQPTQIGNTALHRSSYAGLFAAVKARSPDVKAIGYETWARWPGHPYYTGNPPTFTNAALMQSQLREGYRLSTADVNALYGAGTSTVAPAGDAWERTGFATNLYAGDGYHANNRGTLLSAMVLYGTIYGDPTIRDITLNSASLTALGVNATDAAFLAGVAESVLPEPTTLTVVGAASILVLRRRPVCS